MQDEINTSELIAPLGRPNSRHTEALFHTDDSAVPFYYQHFWTEWAAPSSDDCCSDFYCSGSDIDSLPTLPASVSHASSIARSPRYAVWTSGSFVVSGMRKSHFIRLWSPIFHGQIWMILTLVSCCSPQQAEGVIWSHSYPKAFVQLQKRILFLLFSNFLSQKSSTWNICRSLDPKSSLPALLKHSFWSSYPDESWAILAV